MIQKLSVLVIEDEANICNLLDTILTTNGYQVVTEGTCSKGIMMMRSYVPDLVILDLGLPDGDGMDFLKKTYTKLLFYNFYRH